MRKKTTENKLMNIGKKYYKEMWAPISIPNKMVTPLKNTSSEIQTQQNSMLQSLNRPRQLQNKISRCLNFTTETKSNERYECKNDTPTTRVLQNDLEEVLYSDGEGVTDPYPSNTWDSEEEIGDDEYSLTLGWL